MTVIEDKIEKKTQASRWSLVVGRVFEFRAFCCDIDSQAIMGVEKEPVIQLTLSPDPSCVGDTISWDLTASYAPGSTITFWSIDFQVLGGVFSGTNIATASGTFAYSSAGSFDVEITITEGLGKTQTATREVNVLDCSTPVSSDEFGSWSYVGTNGSGVYFIDWTEGSPDWVAKNQGLTGDALTVRDLVIHPNTRKLNPGAHELWIATKGGLFYSLNGGNSWQPAPTGDPENVTYADSPPPTAADLDWWKVVIDDDDAKVIYALATASLES